MNLTQLLEADGLQGLIFTWKSISTKRCSSSGLRSCRLSHPYDAVPYEVSGLRLCCSIPKRPKHYHWNQTGSNPEWSVYRCTPFYNTQTLGVSMHISMAWISLFLQEMFLQKNKTSLHLCCNVFKKDHFSKNGEMLSQREQRNPVSILPEIVAFLVGFHKITPHLFHPISNFSYTEKTYYPAKSTSNPPSESSLCSHPKLCSREKL